MLVAGKASVFYVILYVQIKPSKPNDKLTSDARREAQMRLELLLE